jgi:transposase InsO family protein
MSFANPPASDDSEIIEEIPAQLTVVERQLCEQIDLLKSQLASLQSLAAQSTNQSAPAIPSLRSPKCALPLTFSNGKDPTCANFVSQVKSYLVVRRNDFPDDLLKIHWFSTFLAGEAATWFEAVNRGSSPAQNLPWSEFLNNFLTRFGDRYEESHAEEKLRTIIQGGLALDGYIAKFYEIVAKVNPDFSVDDMTLNFRRGLNSRYLAQDAHFSREKGQPLEKVIEVYREIDRRLEENRHLQSLNVRSLSKPPFTAPPKSGNPLAPVDHSQPMDLDASSRAAKYAEEPVDKEGRKEFRMKNGLCLYCGSNQHLLEGCSKVQKKEQKKFSTGIDLKALAMEMQKIMSNGENKAPSPCLPSSESIPIPEITLDLLATPNSSPGKMLLDVTLNGGKPSTVAALLDSGADVSFISFGLAKKLNIPLVKLPEPIPLRLADGELTESIVFTTEPLSIMIADHQESLSFMVTSFGESDDFEIILGHNWFYHNKARVNFRKYEVTVGEWTLKGRPLGRHVRFRTEVDCILPQIALEEQVLDLSFLKLPIDDVVPSLDSELPELCMCQWDEGCKLRRNCYEADCSCIWDKNCQEKGFCASAASNTVELNSFEIEPFEEDFEDPFSSPFSQNEIPVGDKISSNPSGENAAIPEWVLEEYKDVFAGKDELVLPLHSKFDCSIPLKQGTKPKRSKFYPLTIDEKISMNEWITVNLNRGFIQRSKSEWASPCFFIKQNGKKRLCMDYRSLNSATLKSKAAIPLMSEVFVTLSAAKVFTCIDLRTAYHQVRVAEEDVHKTAFITPMGQFESLVMLFGLTNAPADFQAIMNEIFFDLDYVLAYLDDITIFSDNIDEHEARTRIVFDRLRKHGFFCNLEKCQFNLSKISYLGYIVSSKGLSMDPTKVSSVTDWPTPMKKRDVQSFLGFANFYRRFIFNFSKVTVPLTQLLKKGVDFVWSIECENAFQNLKTAFFNGNMLLHPSDSKPFVMETDASDFALGAVLYQKNDDGVLQPVGFYSRQLLPAERNYPVYERELLAIVASLKHWRHLLMGSRHQIQIHSDHKNLLYFQTATSMSPRLARWSMYLSCFDFAIHYLKGSENERADILSRRPDYEIAAALNPTPPKALLPPDAFVIDERPLEKVDIMTGGIPILEPQDLPPTNSDVLLEDFDLNEDWPLAILHFLLTGEWINMPEQFLRKCLSEKDNFAQKDGTLYRVLPDKVTTVQYCRAKDRQSKVKQLHEGIGHFKFDSLKDIISLRFWWPNWQTTVRQVIQNCPQCQMDQSANLKVKLPLNPLPPAPLPFMRWGIDFVQDLPLTASGNRHIITAIDYATRWVVTKAVPNRTSAEMVKFLYDDILVPYGCPQELISDRASAIVAGALPGYLAIQGIRHKATTPYHPQTNGMVERMHSSLTHAITTLSNSKAESWDEYLAQTTFALRVRKHAVTGFSPFQLLYGIEPTIPGDTLRPLTDLESTELDEELDHPRRDIDNLQRARGLAYTRSEKQAEIMRQRHQFVEQSDAYKFKINDWVKLKNHQSNKFEYEWKGPYWICDVGFPGTYYLQDFSGRTLTNTYNEKELAHWRRSPEGDAFYYDGTQRYDQQA